MGDPIWLDTNTLDFALKGHAAVNKQLDAYRKAGRKLLVPPKVADEALNGNVLTMKKGQPVWTQVPSPALKAAKQKGMEKLGIEIDMRSSEIPRTRRVAYSEIKVDNVSDSDRIALSQIKAARGGSGHR